MCIRDRWYQRRVRGRHSNRMVKAWVLFLGCLAGCSGFQVLVDLNLFSLDELSRVSELPTGLDGAWEISVNSPNASNADWKKALATVAPNGFYVTEDNPMSFAECHRFANITGRPPSLSFNYHETGGSPHTQLSAAEISEVSRECGAKAVILTRAYWPNSEWKTGVTDVLNCSELGGVAMEFNPGDYGKRNEKDFVTDVLAAGKKAFFLMSPGADGLSQEADITAALDSYILSLIHISEPTRPY
eukprot:TRINITY_DN18233_c0_g1_i1.p1 TRINITY_DN18233_c0_g1~~TRINITY_DN18233_c0_g1_i1.p1  ORF type:complete len:244 (-),score=51.66 TRINITY_DN18233_c0_g1_i1:75-806(-)